MSENSSIRDRVGLSTEPACLRKVTHKKDLVDSIKVEIPILRVIATSDIRLCPVGSANRQKMVLKGDEVMIIKDYQSCDGPVWVIVKNKKGVCKVYKRHNSDITESLPKMESGVITGVIKEEGMAGDIRRVAHNVVTQKRCYCVELDGMEVEPFWFESGIFVEKVDELGEKILVLDPMLCVREFKSEKRISLKFVDPEKYSKDSIISSFRPLDSEGLDVRNHHDDDEEDVEDSDNFNDDDSDDSDD